MPTVAEIDPIAIPPRLLSHLMLIDVEPGTGAGGRPRFRFRLIGTYVIEILGRENTGRYFDEIYPPEIYDDMTAGLAWLVENGRPLRSGACAVYAGKGWLDVEFLLLPFAGTAANPATVSRVMMVMDAGPRAARDKARTVVVGAAASSGLRSQKMRTPVPS